MIKTIGKQPPLKLKSAQSVLCIGAAKRPFGCGARGSCQEHAKRKKPCQGSWHILVVKMLSISARSTFTEFQIKILYFFRRDPSVVPNFTEIEQHRAK